MCQSSSECKIITGSPRKALRYPSAMGLTSARKVVFRSGASSGAAGVSDCDSVDASSTVLSSFAAGGSAMRSSIQPSAKWMSSSARASSTSFCGGGSGTAVIWKPHIGGGAEESGGGAQERRELDECWLTYPGLAPA